VRKGKGIKVVDIVNSGPVPAPPHMLPALTQVVRPALLVKLKLPTCELTLPKIKSDALAVLNKSLVDKL
jgi:hypothetical protein